MTKDFAIHVPIHLLDTEEAQAIKAFYVGEPNEPKTMTERLNQLKTFIGSSRA